MIIKQHLNLMTCVGASYTYLFYNENFSLIYYICSFPSFIVSLSPHCFLLLEIVCCLTRG